ncbi:hypothetical protein ONZ43_g7415 [Nemania bipapillata]|uniref:Uncharacterized protein n=1 Tax=Nemania bipapillata TaxID=110536 RepID=A0ACC2HQW2_9PEZI|nr:hypothetical protein ONZ43_g7415 [Nemania bipapillata]
MQRVDQAKVVTLTIKSEVNIYRATVAFLFPLVLLDVKGPANLHHAFQQARQRKPIPVAAGFLEVPSGVE